MTKQELKKKLKEATEPAILVIDEKQNIEYYSSNISKYLKLPENFNKLLQLDRLNKTKITTLAKKAINAFNKNNENNFYSDLISNGNSHFLVVKIQKIEVKNTQNNLPLYSINILKEDLNGKPSKKDKFEYANKTSAKELQILKSKLNEVNAELTFLKKENKRLRVENGRKEANIIEALKQKQLQLEEAEGRYKNLFENSVDGVVVFDLNTQNVVQVNNRLVKMTDFTKTEIIENAPLGMLTEFLEDGSSSRKQYFNMLTELKTKKISSTNFMHLHKTKAPFHVKVSVSKMPKPHSHLIAVFIRNIDVRKRAEVKGKLHLAQLKTSESRYKTFFNQSLDGHFIFNLKAMKPVEINRRMLQILRLSKTEYYSANQYDFLDNENNSFDTEQILKDFKVHIDKKTPFELEVYIKSSKRKSFLVKVLMMQLPAPNNHLIYAVVKDIDKERKAEEASSAHLKALTTSESMHKTFFNQSIDGQLILNAEDMMPVEVNERMLKMFSISKTDFFNTDLYDFCDKEKNNITQEQLYRNIKAHLTKNKPYEIEVFMRSRKRTSFFVRLLFNLMGKPNQHLIYAVIKDIDKEHQAKSQAAAHLKALEASESMFRTFFENGLDGFGIAQIFPKPKPIDVNQRMLQLTGLSRKEFLHSNILDFINPEQANNKSGKEVFDEITQSLLQKGYYRGEVVYLHKKNGPFYTNITMVRLKPPNDNKIFIQVADKDKEMKAIQQVAKSEALFKSIFANSLDGIVIYNMDTFNPVNFNERVLEMTNCTRQEFVNAKTKDFLPEKQPNGKASLPLFIKYLKNVSENKSFNIEWLFKKYNSDELVYARISVVRLPEPFTKLAVISIADITEAKLAEQSIKEKNKTIAQTNEDLKLSLQKFKDTFNNSVNFIGRINLNGFLLEHNQTVSNNLIDNNQPSTNILVWRFPWFKNHKNSQKQFKQDFEQAKKGFSTKSRVTYSVSPNFSGVLEYTFKPLKNEKGEITTILGEGYDITQQVNALKKMALNEQKFRAIYNNSANFIGLFNTKGVILDINKTVTDITVENEAQIIGIPVWEYLWFADHKDTQQAFKKGVKQAARGERVEGIADYTVSAAFSGTMQFTINPIFDDKGKVVWLLGEGRDITEIINKNKELAYKEQKFRAIFDNSSNLIGLYDKEGYIEELNQPFLEQIDKSKFPKAIQKFKIWDVPWTITYKYNRQNLKANFKKALNGKVRRGIIEYKSNDNYNYTSFFEYTLSPIFDENKKVIKVLCEGKDITEKINSRKQIETSEKRFRDLFYNAENVIVRLSAEGKVIANNRIIKGDINYESNKKYLGTYFWELIEAKGNQKARNKLKQDLEKAINGQLVSESIVYNKTENQEVQLAYSLKPIFGPKRKVEWILSESRDITAVIKTQRELFKNEQKFRAIFNNSSNFIGLYNLDGTIEELNQLILDKIPEGKLSKINSKTKIWELPLSVGFKKVIKQTFKASLKKVLKGEIYKGTAEYSINGEDVALEFIFSPVFDENNKVFKVLGEGRDITEQANSRKQIEASEKRFKALFYNAENTIVRLSPEGSVIAHSKIQNGTKNYNEVKKYIGKYLWDFSGVFNNKEAQTQLKQDIEKAANGNLVSGVIFSKRSNYTPIQLAYSLKPIFSDNNTVDWILAEAKDITDIVTTQNQLLKNEQKFRAIFYNSDNYIARLDVKGNVLESNRVHTDSALYDMVKKHIGMPLWELSGILNYPKSVIQLKKDIKKCSKGNFISSQMYMLVHNINKKEEPTEFKTGLVVYSLTPVFDKNQNVDWILAEAKDISELDNAKNELSLSLNKYQKLFENNLVGILTLDENLKILDCNKAYEKIVGYSLKELKALNYYKLIDKKEIAAAKSNEQKIRSGKIKSLHFNRTFTKKNGEKVTVKLYLKPVYLNKKFNSAVVTIADITELENNRKALKQSEELYKAVFEGVNDGLYVYNFKKHEIVTFNKQLVKIAGYSNKKAFLKRATSQYIPYIKGENKQNINWLKAINTQFKTQKIVKFDLRIDKDNGTHLDISTASIQLSDSLLLTAITDVTEIKKAQQALLESEIKYRSLFENNITGIALGNKFGQILQANDALCNMFGYSKKEMLNLTHQDLSVQGKDIQSYMYFESMVRGKVKKFSTTKQYVKKSGEIFYAIINVSGVYDIQNNFKYNITSISDISELKYLENELKEKQIELADKVKELEKYIESNLELENFAFIASHDLKSPTKTIINFSNLLLQTAGNKLDEQEHEFLKFIVDGSNRLQNTINDLLNFSLANNNDLNIEKVNLKNLVKNIIKDLNSSITKSNTSITIKYLPNYNWVDKGLYKQLFLNLITNAIKFQKKGRQPIIKINCQKTSDGFLFSVEDNGIGIPKKLQHKIFGIFKRLHVYDEYEGTGIGLALCKKVVEKHKGKIWVESAKGKGATFYFTLPKNLKRLHEKV